MLMDSSFLLLESCFGELSESGNDLIKPLQRCDPNGYQKSVMINRSTAPWVDIDGVRRCAIAN